MPPHPPPPSCTLLPTQIRIVECGFGLQQKINSGDVSYQDKVLFLSDGSLQADLADRLKDPSVSFIIIDSLLMSCRRSMADLIDARVMQEAVAHLIRVVEKAKRWVGGWGVRGAAGDVAVGAGG